MTIVQQPDALSLSYNIRDFRISSTAAVSFVLKKGATELVAQTYEPGQDGYVTVKVRDIVHAQLAFGLQNVSTIYEQPDIVADFTAVIDSTEVTFRVIRAGVDNFADTAANFLTSNWLTWQPQEKPVTYSSPEFLTYYAVIAGTCKLKAYYTDESGTVTSEETITVATLTAGKAYTIPMQYAAVSALLGNKLPAFYDVWIENGSGSQLTYIQRYYAGNMKSEQEDWILFENSLGGIDTFRAYGATNFTGEHTHNIAEIDEVSEEYRVDTERKYQKNTGYLNERERIWLLDFFPSRKKYIFLVQSLLYRSIVVTESDVTYTNKELPSSYTFTYKYANALPLLNISRVSSPIETPILSIYELSSFRDPVFVELLKKHIDGTTIYWDDANKVIKAKGGGDVETYDIAISLASSVGGLEQWSLSVSGNYTEIVEDGTSKTRTVKGIVKTGFVEISFSTTKGYAISSLTLDGESQEDTAKIRLEKIESDHSIGITLQDISVTPPMYQRSDTGAIYTGLSLMISKLLADYPTGLTQDVEITCIEEGTDQRGNKFDPKPSLYNAFIKEWNYDTEYTLTIDGDNKLTIDGDGVGGLYFDGVGGLIIKGIKFINCWTYEGVSTTESEACVRIKNTYKHTLKNIYVGDITILGQSRTNSSSDIYRTRYGIRINGVENVHLYNIQLTQVTVLPVLVVADVCYLSKIIFNESNMHYGIIGHPSILNITASLAYICDCDINGATYSYDPGIYIDKIKYLYFYRNKIHNFDGPVFSLTNSYGIQVVDFDSNYMYSNVLNPAYYYGRSWIYTMSDTDVLKFNNNTIVHTSSYAQTFFMRSSNNVGKFIHYNNIYQRIAGDTIRLELWLFNSLKELLSGNNVYNINSGVRYYYTVAKDSVVLIQGALAEDLDKIKEVGYDANSTYLLNEKLLLMTDRPCLTTDKQSLYLPNTSYLSKFDINYKKNSASATLGCDNYNSIAFDESLDITSTYTGINIDNYDSFNSDGATYNVPAEEQVVLHIDSLNRAKINRLILSDGVNTLQYLGKLALIKPYPNVDENGEYLSDKLYNVEVE